MPQLTAEANWEMEYAIENRMSLNLVADLCRRMRDEPIPMKGFGTASNWAHKRKVKLTNATRKLSEVYFDMIVSAGDETADIAEVEANTDTE